MYPLLVTSLCVIGTTTVIFVYRSKISEFASYGYLGAFVANLVSNTTIFVPVPVGLIGVALGAILNPFLAGLAAGAGATIGEMSGYILGRSGRIVVNDSRYVRAVQWLRKWANLTIFVFAATPLPFDLASIAAGALRFPVWKFLLACWLGKTVLAILLAFAGSLGWKIIIPFMS